MDITPFYYPVDLCFTNTKKPVRVRFSPHKGHVSRLNKAIMIEFRGVGTMLSSQKLLAFFVAAGLLAGCGGGGDGGTVEGENGVAQDDYVIHALVWCDTDGNGTLDEGEESTYSSDIPATCGRFHLARTCSGDDARLVLKGVDDGVHVTQNVGGDCLTPISNFTGTMTAPAGYSYITPVSSLVEELSNDPDIGTVADAENKVKSVFGLTKNQSIGQTDINAAGDANKEVKKAALVVQQLLLDSTSAVQGAVGEPVTPSAFSKVTKEMAGFVKAQATKIADIDENQDTTDEEKETLKNAKRIVDTSGSVRDSVVADSVTSLITNTMENNTSEYGNVKARVGVLVEMVKEVSKSNVARIKTAVDKQAANRTDSKTVAAAFNTEMTNLQRGASQSVNTMVSLVKDYLDETKTVITNDDGVRELAAVMNSVRASLETTIKNVDFKAPSKGLEGSTKEVANLTLDNKVSAMLTDYQETVTQKFEQLEISDALLVAVPTNLELASLAVKSTYVNPEDENNPPVVDTTFTVKIIQGKEKTFTLAGSDPDSDTLIFSNLAADDGDLSDFVADADGDLVGSGGKVTYRAGDQVAGTRRQYTYTLADSRGAEAAESGVLTVEIVDGPKTNLAPIANAATFTLNAKDTIQGTLSGFDLEDSIADPVKPLTFNLVAPPSHHTGTFDFEIGTDGTFTYVNDNTAGDDTFTFTVSDSGFPNSGPQELPVLSSAVATVTLSVLGVAEQNEIDNLFLVPVYEQTEEVVAGSTLIQDSTLNDVRNFSISYLKSEDTITLSAENFPFDMTGQVMAYDAVDQKYGVKVSNDNAVALSLSIENGRVFTYTTDQGNTQHLFTLASQEQVCAFTFNAAETLTFSSIPSAIGTANATLLDDISLMNGRDLVCP